MIKATFVNLRLSKEVHDRLSAQLTDRQTISTIINDRLTAIDPSIQKLEDSTRKLEISTPIALTSSAHQIVSTIHERHLDLSVSQLVDCLLYLHFSAVVPTIRNDALIVGTKEGCQIDQPVQVKLKFGLLKSLDRPNNRRYWYWRYYDTKGKRKDRYLGTNLDKALAKVVEIGIPSDAKPHRINKAKKTWAIA